MIIIGEKINGTRKAVKPMILERREEQLVALARQQSESGATYIDINVGTGTGTRADEMDAMRWAVTAVKAAVGKPICVDSADPAVLAAGLEACGDHNAMINSVKAEATYLDEVLPLVARYAVPVICLAMDEGGIPKDVTGRLQACQTIADAAARHDVPMEKLFFDPLVLPIATDATQARVTLDTLVAIKARFAGARTVMGLSNVSYGLPARARMNAAFLGMALYAGLDAAIMDPMDPVMTAAALTGEALMGRDRHFRKYTRAFRNA